MSPSTGQRSLVTAAEHAEIVAAWADSGDFADYVVYEGAGRTVFAAGQRARITLTARGVTVRQGERRTDFACDDDPVDALVLALASLDDPDWRIYGWVGFDFCAPHHGLLDRVPDDAILAEFIVPEFEVWLDRTGPDYTGLDTVVAARLRALAAVPPQSVPPREIDVLVDHDDYRGRVAQAIAEIRRGDYQKVIMSRRVDIPFAVDIPATYVRGRTANTPARSFLLRLGGLEAAGFSPELVVAADASGAVITEPLAGTRALGRSDDLDASARAELLTDAKEIAEHAISVRACVAEIDSVAIPGTTVVSEFMAIRERGSVQHLASTVRGDLRPGAGPWRALEVLFPSITASGIPKTQALEAIYRLEPQRRELYSGAVLTASAAGDLEATLTLRTIFASGGGAWLRAGAGVVGQSNPDREFEETCEKLASVAPYVVPAAAETAAAETAGRDGQR